ncbi:MAG: hypothetical protein V7752_22180 [Halopseudomonas sp.]
MNRQRIIVTAISLALGASLAGCATPTAHRSDPPAETTQPSTSQDKPAKTEPVQTQKEQTETVQPQTTAADTAPPQSLSPTNKKTNSATDAASKVAEYPSYDNAKADFHYGPGQAWPKLVLPPELIPGPLAAAPIAPAVPAAAAIVATTVSTPSITTAATSDQPIPDAAVEQPSPCANELAASSLDIGPKEAWLSSKLKSVAIGALSKALFGFGGSDDDYIDEPEAPPTVDDPIPESARQAFHDKLSDTELTISGQLTDQGLLLSTGIESAPDKSTFHAVYLERKDCQRTFPDRYLNYRIWLEWSLSVSWTKTESHYENDNLVSQTSTSGGFFDSGEINLAEGSVNLADAKMVGEYQQGLLKDLPAPIWQQMGFSSPTSGVRDLGSQFDKVDTAKLFNGDSVAVVHVTRVVDGRFVTRALPFTMQRGAGNLLTFSRL